VVHIEVAAKDAPKLRAFYSGLFGWTFEAMPAMPDYAAASIGGAKDALGFAVFPRTSEGAVPINYIGVASVAEHSARVEQLGGRVVHAFVVPNMGRGAVCADPEGNTIGLWQSDPSATETGTAPGTGTAFDAPPGEVQPLRPGLWRWSAPHPDWTPQDGGPGGWERGVWCLAYEAPDALILIDPQAPADGTPEAARFWETLDRDVARLGRPVACLLTQGWHERSASAVLARYRDGAGATVWVPRASRSDAGGEVTRAFAPGDSLPGGVLAYPAGDPNAGEVLYYLPAHRALFAGDTIVGEGDGQLRLGWIDAGVRERLVAALRPLLDLPLEMVLVSHGRSALEDARTALARALELPAWNR
jgi:predicted enzyme related to lactoylglutathione lyase/glyoxylase-like metal-dependent hydrolase (beta-lactamase superfamily II)